MFLPQLAQRRVVGKASASITALAVQTLASFLLQVLAAATIGAAGLGRYAIVLGLLATLTALQSGLRDSAIVLSGSQSLRSSVFAAQMGGAAVAACVGLVIGWRTGLTSTAEAFLLAAMIGLWSLEEIGRRYLIRDQRFGAVVVNDLVYAIGAFGTVGGIWVTAGDLQLSSFLWAMVVGSALSFFVSIVQLPAGTYRVGPLSVADMREVVTFAGWRSAQVVVRPASMTLIRVVIAGVTSAAVLGQIEAARLLIQPAWVLVSGLGPFLLSHFAKSKESRQGARVAASLPRLAALFVVPVVLWSVAVTALSDIVQPLIVGDEYPVDRLVIAGWGMFHVATAIGFPVATLLVANKDARRVFIARAADGVIGLAAVAALAAGPGVRWAPFGLTVGSAIGALILWRMAMRFTATFAHSDEPTGGEFGGNGPGVTARRGARVTEGMTG